MKPRCHYNHLEVWMKPRWRYNHYLMWWERVGYPDDICIVMRNGWLAKLRRPM